GGISLVDDVGKRLERPQRLALETLESQLHLLYRYRHGDQGNDVPGMADGEQGDRRTEPCFTGARDEAGIEGLACAHDVDQKRSDRQVGNRERDERDQVVEQPEAPDRSAGELEREAARARSRGSRARVEQEAAQGAATKE